MFYDPKKIDLVPNMCRILILGMIMLLLGCTSEGTWQHPSGYDKKRFKIDAAECKAYARDITKENRKTMKIPAGTPHGGVAEAFIIYLMFQDSFIKCMQMKSWTYTEPPSIMQRFKSSRGQS